MIALVFSRPGSCNRSCLVVVTVVEDHMKSTEGSERETIPESMLIRGGGTRVCKLGQRADKLRTTCYP